VVGILLTVHSSTLGKATEMDIVRVSLFGKFAVTCSGHGVEGLESRKVQELLGYLLIHRDRNHSREVLAELMWGNRSNRQSRKYLRQALWQIHTAFQPYTDDRSYPLSVDTDWIRLDPDHLWLDVAEFEAICSRAHKTPVENTAGDLVQALDRAADLYRGELLEGCYEDWCILERERFQAMYLAILDRLVDYSEACKQYELGLAYAQRVLRYDRARERTHRRIMRLYYLTGDRTAALRQYEQMVKILREEIGVAPARSSVQIYEQIRADSLEVRTGEPPNDAGRVGGGEPPDGQGVKKSGVHDALAHLRLVQGLLSKMQVQLSDDIEALEQALADEFIPHDGSSLAM
jgi:DNA-binding SARP family transcriptional activator